MLQLKVKGNKKINVHCLKKAEAVRNKISVVYAKCIEEFAHGNAQNQSFTVSARSS
jgi:hypothetical protein